MRLNIILAVLLGVSYFIDSHAQLGMFTEFTIEASNEVTNLEGNLMDVNLGLQYRLNNNLNFRAGISQRSRKSMWGGYFYRNFFDNIDPMTFSSESISLNHRGVFTGYSVFGGIEITPKKFLLGIDLHYQQSDISDGRIEGFYSFSSNSTFFSRGYIFPTDYESISFTKLSLRLGYQVYQKPRGGITLFANYSRDFSENERLETIQYDEMILQLVNDIPITPGYSQSSITQFLNNSYLNYDRNYFSIGVNVSYFFNVEVEKPIGNRIGE